MGWAIAAVQRQGQLPLDRWRTQPQRFEFAHGGGEVSAQKGPTVLAPFGRRRHRLVSRDHPAVKALFWPLLNDDDFTSGSAYAEFADPVKGTITPGKLADLVLLDRDLYRASPKSSDFGKRVIYANA